MIRAVLLDFGETLVERISDRDAPLTDLTPVPFPETASVLRQLKEAGFLLAVVSNTEQTDDAGMHGVLTKLALGEYLDVMTTSTTMGSRKPDPRIYLHVLGRLGCSPEESVMVGDDPGVDLAGAAAVGMRTILVRRGTPRPSDVVPDFIVPSLLDVPPVLAGLDARGGGSDATS